MKPPITNYRLPMAAAGCGRAPLNFVNRQSSIVNSCAFSLVEILVVIALMSVIILGLLAMFNQTQRAFRAGMTQVDVLGAGRLATDMIVRELEQITPTRQAAANFYAWLPNQPPLVQPLPGTTYRRTNLLQDLFFVYRRNQEWIGVGYFVRTNDLVTGNVGLPRTGSAPHLGAGVLYRFEANVAPLTGRSAANLYADFANVAYAAQWPANPPATRIMDGVVHFKVRAFDTNGLWVHQPLNDRITNFWSVAVPDELAYALFASNAVPASVELEIGVLENRVWDRYRSIPNPTIQGNYLVSNTVGSLHLFRQRIPVRNVDPSAYQPAP